MNQIIENLIGTSRKGRAGNRKVEMGGKEVIIMFRTPSQGEREAPDSRPLGLLGRQRFLDTPKALI